MKRLDTLKKLYEKMDTLVLKVVEEAEKLSSAKADERLDVMKHVTAYMSMRGRSPQDSEGAEIHAFRERLRRDVGRGGDTGDGDGDPDPPDGADALDADDSGDGEPEPHLRAVP